MSLKILKSFLYNRCSTHQIITRYLFDTHHWGLHTSAILSPLRPARRSYRRLSESERPTEPYKYTASRANIRSMKAPVLANRFERPILFVSLFSFCLYWFYLREENDLDQGLKVSLFERVPGAEEPHLRQLIPRMRTAGQDTREAEARLKELVKAREAREAQAAAKTQK